MGLKHILTYTHDLLTGGRLGGARSSEAMLKRPLIGEVGGVC